MIMENLNLAELLKDCPKGMKLYSPIFGDVYLDKIRPHLAIVVTTDKEQGNLKEEFLYDGRYGMNGECMLFPSKGKTTWEGFIPFVKGDIIYTDGIVAILHNITEIGTLWYYCYYSISEDRCKIKTDYGIGNVKDNEFRLATEEEKQKLFQAIEADGYKWNPETKTLEKLVEPKFKVGDKIKHKNGYFGVSILKINTDCYTVKDFTGDQMTIDFTHQDNYELVPNKFDITTLKAFDKVLVRNTNSELWRISLFGCFSNEERYFMCLANSGFYQCIPYEVNKELLGTTNDCDPFFKTWEK